MEKYLILGLVGLVLVIIISIYNSFKRYGLKTAEAMSTIDVYLTKRYNLITNLVEVVKGYKEYELNALESIVKGRNINTLPISEKAQLDGEINSNLNRILSLTEAYPNLKANEMFLDLQNTLVKLEEDIAAARRMYNGNVTAFNDLLQTFPSNVLGIMMGEKPKLLFVADSEKKNMAEVNF